MLPSSHTRTELTGLSQSHQKNRYPAYSALRICSYSSHSTSST
jgi:hypothetical protein